MYFRNIVKFINLKENIVSVVQNIVLKLRITD